MPVGRQAQAVLLGADPHSMAKEQQIQLRSGAHLPEHHAHRARHVTKRSLVLAAGPAPHTASIACCHVLSGGPILFVSHDLDDGGWQFLCDATTEHHPREACVVGLSHLIEQDPSLNALAAMPVNHHAVRSSPQAAWRITDEAEVFIREQVAAGGWAVQMIPAGATEPPFAYTVGLFANFHHPELLIVGLPLDAMHTMLNTLGERIKAGDVFTPTDRIAGVIKRFEVVVRAVKKPKSLSEYVWYARRFYGRKRFSLMQVLWPDRDGKFPRTSTVQQPLPE